MPRVQIKEEDSFGSLTPFNQVMTIWTQWITLRDRNEPGGYAHPQDVKDFMRVGEAVEAMVNDLPRHLWWAIRKSRGISTVWLFPNLSLMDALEEAENKLVPKMQQHIVTRRYFD